MKKAIEIMNENTTVPFKIVFPLMTAIVTATIWIMTILYQIKAAQYDVVRRPDFRVWRDELAEMNPQLKIPYTDRRSSNRATAGE